MTVPANFKPSPWDSAAFGLDVYEIEHPSIEDLGFATHIPGHFTVRVDPLVSKRALHDYGFYYCDTLIEPYCSKERFTAFDQGAITITRDIALEALLEICHGAFSHGRFHRDFNLDSALADLRYDNWLSQLHASHLVYGLMHHDKLAGFIAVNGHRLVLHAVAENLRGKGVAKYLWTPVCRELFEQGWGELVSSVSATNLAVLNLYSSLGFRFRRPLDVYHRLTT